MIWMAVYVSFSLSSKPLINEEETRETWETKDTGVFVKKKKFHLFPSFWVVLKYNKIVSLTWSRFYIVFVWVMLNPIWEEIVLFCCVSGHTCQTLPYRWPKRHDLHNLFTFSDIIPNKLITISEHCIFLRVII